MPTWSQQDQDEWSKIDYQAVLGLAGTANSLAYKVNEIEKHLHGYESWFGVAASPSGETNIADRLGNGIASFQIDAGNETWGAWLQILGSADTPARGTNVYYDLHRILVTAAERANSVYFIQLAFGTSGAAALSAGDFSEIIYYSPAAVNRSAPVDIQGERHAATTKAWARCLCIGQDTATLNFYIGMHEYSG